MPRISEETRTRRRRHVLTSAWSCFSRDGFHATSMDKIIEAAGMSSSAVYRYFRSKDELIDATVDEALALTEEMFARLLAADPVPSPARTLELLTDTVHSRGENADYDLSRLAMQAWTEALRRPHLRERTARYYRTAREHFGELARHWQQAGHIAPDADPEAVAALLTTLMPGIIVGEHLVDGTSGTQLLDGISAFTAPRTHGSHDDE
ncbi:TetR/AcrR family transcriptional regulator [Kitasatospora sp. NPDC052896]|uniref:TetR/AcrR family transcriptional regulator n=1 Tax=Kitasatospora sp. NPDC052896 TaxID=3364061 RepID=UPI0037CA3BAB